MFNVLYNATMPKKKAPEERKDYQIGFRIKLAQHDRLEVLIARIKSIDKRVSDTEIYEELMSLREPEFITDKDRLFLWSGSSGNTSRTELKNAAGGTHGLIKGREPRNRQEN